MTFLAVDPKKTITPDLAADILKQGAYISPDIVSVKIEKNALRCDVHSGADTATLPSTRIEEQGV
jgi:hypothetical protein